MMYTFVTVHLSTKQKPSANFLLNHAGFNINANGWSFNSLSQKLSFSLRSFKNTHNKTDELTLFKFG